MVKNEYKPILVYEIDKLTYFLIGFIWKAITLFIAIFISYSILYQQCLHSSNCNSITTAFFAILAFIFFEVTGLPVSKFVRNINFNN